MRPWIRRGFIGLMGAGITLGGLAACGTGPTGPGMMDGPGFGRHHGMHRGPMSEADFQKMRERMIERVSGELQLDAAQKERFASLVDKMHAQRRALMGEPGQPREDIKSLIAGERFDRAKAQALVDSKTGAVKAASPEMIAAMGDFYDSLKPEQQAKVREFMERRGGRGWGRHRG